MAGGTETVSRNACRFQLRETAVAAAADQPGNATLTKERERSTEKKKKDLKRSIAVDKVAIGQMHACLHVSD